MMQFVQHLTRQQIMTFFDGVGTFDHISKSHSRDMLDVFFRNGYQLFWFSIADNFISAYGFNKSSEDWKLYMKSIFGKEYMREYGEEPVHNSFIEQLSDDDIRELIKINNMTIKEIREAEAFRPGTRRYKIELEAPTYNTIDIVVGPHLDYCSEIPGITESFFMKFFTQKFGMDFISYYIEVEKKNSNKLIEEYKKKREENLDKKRRYMLEIWQK